MADNTELNPGAGGDIIASDEINGVKYQRVKPAFGTDGFAVDVSAENPLPTLDSNSSSLLNRILQMLMAPLGYDKSLGRHRNTAVIESGTVTTVNTLANVSAVGGYSAQMQIFDTNRTAWSQCVRARIT
jgi:hypothetical protein